MLLAIDCGNTNTVFSIWDGARFIAESLADPRIYELLQATPVAVEL